MPEKVTHKAAAAAFAKAFKEGMDCLEGVKGCMKELSEMEVGTRWCGMRRMACKAHHDALDLLCKAMSESSLDEGGAAVPDGGPGPEAKAEEVPPPPPEAPPPGAAPPAEEARGFAALAVREALAPVGEMVYRLTGRRPA